jgi:hypothetical protein
MTTRSEFWIGTKMADFRQDEKQSLILLTSGLLLLNRLAGFGDVARKWACVPHGKKNCNFYYFFNGSNVSPHYLLFGYLISIRSQAYYTFDHFF